MSPDGAHRPAPARLTPLHLIAGIAATVTLLPMTYLVLRAVGLGWETVSELLLNQRTLALTLRSLTLCLGVAIACVLIGLPLAWLLARTDVPGRSAWLFAVTLPLAIPSYVMAYAWVATFPGMSGGFAAGFVLALSCMPYVILPTYAILRRIDPGYDEVARTLGMTPAQSFRRITVPLAMPAAAAGALIVALYVLSDFGAVSLLRFDSFTRVIYNAYRASFDRSSAAVLALLLALLACLLVLLERRLRDSGHSFRVGAGSPRAANPIPLGRWRAVATSALAAYVGLSLAFPLATLVRLMGRGTPSLDGGELLAAFANTAGLAALGAAIGMALAIPLGLLAARHRDRVAGALESAAYLGHALPGVVVGLSLVFLSLRVVPSLYQTSIVLGFAYAVLFLSNAIGAVRTSAEKVPPILEDTSRSLGLGPVATWRRVTLRLASPGLAAGTALVAIAAMKELPATLMLRPTGADTLATELWTRTSVGAYSEAAPYAFAIIALALVPAIVLSLVTRNAADSDAPEHVPEAMEVHQ